MALLKNCRASLHEEAALPICADLLANEVIVSVVMLVTRLPLLPRWAAGEETVDMVVARLPR